MITSTLSIFQNDQAQFLMSQSMPIKVILLDGGVGQELIHRSNNVPSNLWSLKVMMDHPWMVEEVHCDFFNAGASVATTNTYCIHRDRLHKTLNLEEQFDALYHTALQSAENARRRVQKGKIAGSIGPLICSYRTNICLSHMEAVTRYKEIAQLLAPHVDIILCETVASLAQAHAILQGVRMVMANGTIWLSVTLDDSDVMCLRSSEKVKNIVKIAHDYQVSAILANCSVPEVMGSAMNIFSDSGLPFGAYANGFSHISDEFIDSDSSTVALLKKRQDLSPEKYADFAMEWIAKGATIVGGCCEVGPNHIAEIASRLRATNGYEIANDI